MIPADSSLLQEGKIVIDEDYLPPLSLLEGNEEEIPAEEEE